MRTKPALTASDVHQMAAACRAEAEKNKWGVTFAIVDDAGRRPLAPAGSPSPRRRRSDR